jgi:glutaconyl-CoA decarboxylase
MSRYTIEIEGSRYRVEVLEDMGSEARVIVNGREFRLAVTAKAGAPAPLAPPIPLGQPSTSTNQTPIALAGAYGEIRAPMPARVTQVLAKAGDPVEEGQLLLKIEAMKMENEVLSPVAGTVEKVCVSDGQEVGGGELLVKIHPS